MNQWPFCTEEATCSPAGAIVIALLLATILVINLFSYLDKKSKERTQAENEAVNVAWLRSQGLRDQTLRSIVEGFFKVSGRYPIGIPKIDWDEGEAILSIKMNNRTIALEVDLKKIEWVRTTEATTPTAQFIYGEELLRTDLEIGYYEYGSLEKAVKKLTIEKILGMADSIKVVLSEESYNIVHKSII